VSDLLVPNDPTKGQEFFWTRQGISLQHLYEYIQMAVAAAVGSTTPGTGGSGGGGVVIGTGAGQAADAAAVADALSVKAPISSPAFTGTPTAPTAVTGTNTTQIATTAFVLANGGSGSAALNSPTFTGTPTAPTAAPDTNTTQIATTAYVDVESASVQLLISAQSSLIDSLTSRVQALELVGANVTAIVGAAAARNNPTTGTPLSLDTVALWLVDGTAPTNAINNDIVLNRASV
jgi:hypothetical protein